MIQIELLQVENTFVRKKKIGYEKCENYDQLILSKQLIRGN